MRTILSCFSLLLPFFLFAQTAGQPLPIDPGVRVGMLPNGMRYYIQYNQKPEKRAELRLAVHAGSLQEDENQLGLAHFVEHMAFNGTEHFEKNELINYLEKTGTRFGADLNAYTSFEETVYLLQARTDSLHLLEKGLLIMEDWAAGLSFEPGEIDKERGVVVSEWRTRLSPDQRLQKKYFPILYQGSRYARRMPIGEPEMIENADYHTIQSFYEDWYRPELMAFVAVGDFDVEWMEKEIIRRFSTLSNPEPARPREEYPVPGHAETLFAIATDKEAAFTRVQVINKHEEAPVETVEGFRRELAHSLYNKMLNARMVEVQMQPNPPFTFAYSGYGSDVGNLGAYTQYAFVREGGAIEGISAVLRETRRAALHGFTETELERHKADLLQSVENDFNERDKTQSASLASRYVYHYLDQNPIPGPEQRLELYRELLPTITLEDINPLPRQWLTDSNRVVVITGPENEAVPLPSETEMLALLEHFDTLQLEPYVDEVNDAPLVSAPLSPQPIKSREQLDSLGITVLELSNRVKAYLKPTDFQNDEILMTAFSPGGHSVYDETTYYSAANAATIVDQSGIGDFSMPELQKKLAGIQANAGPYINELYEGVSGNSNIEGLETMLQMVYLYFTAPRRDSAVFSSYISRQESIFENMMANPYYYFADVKNQVKYQGHPRRQITDLASLQKIKLDEVQRTYRDRFANAGDFTFVFVGNFEPAALEPLLATYLGNLPSTGRQESWKDVGANLAEGYIDTTIVRGEAPKALVEMNYHGPFEYEGLQRYHFYSLLSALRIRLREAMREDKGGVYGVSVNGIALPFPEPRYRITLSFNSEPGRTQELIATAKEVIATLQTEGIDDETLQKVKETQRQGRIKGLKENGFWLGQISTRLKYGIGLEGIRMERYEPYVEGLSAEDIQNAAQRYLQEDDFIQVVLMPEEGRE
ncbi:MAG: insulinase family protein [Lewinellaceae bacterium]|nr:insulinase family protein [Lewinellaceae bacterium]